MQTNLSYLRVTPIVLKEKPKAYFCRLDEMMDDIFEGGDI